MTLAGVFVGWHHMFDCFALHMYTLNVDNQQMEMCIVSKARLGMHLCALLR